MNTVGTGTVHDLVPVYCVYTSNIYNIRELARIKYRFLRKQIGKAQSNDVIGSVLINQLLRGP